MGRGTCSNGVCTCNAGYNGDDCGQTGEITFSETKDRYITSISDVNNDSTSTSKIILYAAIGAGAGLIVVVVAYIATRIKRNKLRKEAARRQAERQAERQARRNNYSADGNAPRPSSRAQRAVDPNGINVGVVQQQPIQMYQPQNEVDQMYQQFYANPQIQGNMGYYANNYPNGNNNGAYYLPQGQYPPQYVVQQQQQQQGQQGQGHRVIIPPDA